MSKQGLERNQVNKGNAMFRGILSGGEPPTEGNRKERDVNTILRITAVFTMAAALSMSARSQVKANIINTTANPVPVQVTNPVQPPSSITVNNTAAQPVPVQVTNPVQPASSVAVNNTSTNPVPSLDTERVARIPYASTSEVSCTNPNAPTAPCDFNTFTAPPSGFRLVAQNISGLIRLGDASVMPFALIRIEGTNHFLAVPGSVSMGTDSGNNGIINQSIVGYFKFTPDVTVDANFAGPFTSQLTISGYLENCAITSCPAMVGQ